VAGLSGGRAAAARGTMAARGVGATVGREAARGDRRKDEDGRVAAGRSGAVTPWPGSGDARARGPTLFFYFLRPVSLGFKGS